MSLYYDIGTHQSKPHTRSSGGVLVPHSAPQGTWMAREHPTWSWRPKQPKWFWRSRPPRSSNPHSCHQESDSKTVRCDCCNKRPANHLISPSSSEWLHVVAHGSVGAAQPARDHPRLDRRLHMVVVDRTALSCCVDHVLEPPEQPLRFLAPGYQNTPRFSSVEFAWKEHVPGAHGLDRPGTEMR